MMVVEVVVVFFFLDMESSDDGSSRMGPDTLTSGQTGSLFTSGQLLFWKPKSNMDGPFF